MSEHEHTVWIKRKDILTCTECGEVLGIHESDFPRDEAGLMDMIAIAAMEVYLGTAMDSKMIAKAAYNTAETMIAERRRRYG